MNPKVSEVSGPSKRKLISNSGDKFYSLSSREYMCQNQLDVKEKGWDVNQVILLATILNLDGIENDLERVTSLFKKSAKKLGTSSNVTSDDLKKKMHVMSYKI